MNIINLQSNDVLVAPDDNTPPVTFPTEGRLQVRMNVENVTVTGVVKHGSWSYTRGLPHPVKDTIYIVSSLVAMFELYENNRRDLVFPWGMIRTDSGRVIACRALCRPERKPEH